MVEPICVSMWKSEDLLHKSLKYGVLSSNFIIFFTLTLQAILFNDLSSSLFKHGLAAVFGFFW